MPDQTMERTEQSPRRSISRTVEAVLRSRLVILFLTWCTVILLFVDITTAANGLTLSKQPRDTLAVPRWLYLATGGATVGASALLASFVTDRAFIRYLHRWSLQPPSIGSLWRPLVWCGRALGVIALALAVYFGYEGPQLATASLTILVTFAGVRAGLPIVTYLVGNVWPVLNPWRTIVSLLPTGFREYPASLQRWPAVAGLILLVWVEVIFPVSTVPRILATGILAYSTLTLAGAILFGPDPWFENADPLSVLFRLYGAVAPVQRYPDSLRIKLPGSELTYTEGLTDESDIAFVIALIWDLTYSGFITTRPGARTIEILVGVLSFIPVSLKLRAVVIYTAILLAGYVVFFGAYWYAGRVSRQTTSTYITARTIAFRFAPPLLAIAAGYHLAHYAGLFISLSPALVMAILSPLSPPANPLVLTTPPWFDGLKIAFVLIGHLLAVWTAHTAAYDLFPSRLIAIRSQYPFVVVMIGYTIISLWILSLPGAIPPFLS